MSRLFKARAGVVAGLALRRANCLLVHKHTDTAALFPPLISLPTHSPRGERVGFRSRLGEEEVPVLGDTVARLVFLEQLRERLRVQLRHLRPVGPQVPLHRDLGPHCGQNRDERGGGWDVGPVPSGLH